MRLFRNITKPLVIFSLVFFVSGCYPKHPDLEPILTHTPDRATLTDLPSPFTPLSEIETQASWGQEDLIALHFARDLDLYRAVTAFKRALVLLPPDHLERQQEILYAIAFSYYLGHRYEEVVDTVENTSLNAIIPEFPAYQQLLTILYESYQKTDRPKSATLVLEKIASRNRKEGSDLALSTALAKGDFPQLYRYQQIASEPDLSCLLQQPYKSIRRAQQLSTLVPGMGFWYVGQKQSAITAFLLNGLFITASVLLFHNGQWPLGIFTTSLEMGWYFGGIYGAGEAAHQYNRHLYENSAHSLLKQEGLYPSLRLTWGF